MTRDQQPGTPGDGETAPHLQMLSDEELGEALNGMSTSEVVGRTEEFLLGERAVKLVDSEQVAQLDADRRLVELLESTGFEGVRFDKAFRKLSQRLMSYAYPVIGSWVHSGAIFRECLRYRTRIDPPAAQAASEWSRAEREDAVVDSIVLGVDFFRDYALRKRKWDHRRGAALTTYFVGACVCCFSKVCNDRWKKKQLDEAFIRSAPRFEADVVDDTSELVNALPDTGLDIATLVAVRDQAARTWPRIADEQVREALVLHMGGMTQAAAAVEVGLTPKALERRLHTQRGKLSPPIISNDFEDEGRAR
ncbi:hypothetical protein CLV43_101235 [Umezawaea tangerina]|uniref:DNA-directed RNA polymerase specialized sigma24 family protein n=2 Tax=Umezawaea tangerina TaxID=84725 RepID=A0A2T0TK35_9PSEU|nr:hypothetical protein CLV43_101235 [Umezawaea tangerina]